MKLRTFIQQYGAVHRTMLTSGPIGPDAAIVVRTVPEISLEYMRVASEAGEDCIVLYMINQGQAVNQTNIFQRIDETRGIDVAVSAVEDLCERQLEKILQDIRRADRQRIPLSLPPSVAIHFLVDGLLTERSLKTYQTA